MALTFHLTDATIHLLREVGFVLLLFALCAFFVWTFAFVCRSFYREGYHDGVQAAEAAHAKPKAATKEEAQR